MGFGEGLVKFAQWLWGMFPVRIIRSYQRGVKFKKGIVQPEQLEPGIRWGWPFVDSIEVVSIVEDVIDLPTQSITTSDGKTVSFSANISYEVVDLVAYFTNVQDFSESLPRVAAGHLAKQVREWSWDELHKGQKKLEESLKGTLTTRVKGWGVRVIECRLTDCVVAKQYRIYGMPVSKAEPE